jgi:hypothetical protein
MYRQIRVASTLFKATIGGRVVCKYTELVLPENLRSALDAR